MEWEEDEEEEAFGDESKGFMNCSVVDFVVVEAEEEDEVEEEAEGAPPKTLEKLNILRRKYEADGFVD